MNCDFRCDLQMASKTAMKWSKKLTNSQVEKLIKAEKDLNKAIMIFDSGTAEYGNGYRHATTNPTRLPHHRLGSFSRDWQHQTRRTLILESATTTPISESVRISRLSDSDSGIVEVCLDRAERKNAIGKDMLRGLQRAFETVKDDVSANILMVRSSVPHAFCVGADLKERKKMSASENITNSQVEKLIKAEKDLNKAIMIFDLGTAEYGNGYRHDHKTFRVIITKLVSSNRFAAAEELLDRMKEEKVRVPENLFLTLCRGYGRVHRPLDAVRVFQKMKDFDCEASVITYVTILDILVEENRVKAALKLYRYMRENGISPTVASLNVLIKALCKDCGTVDSAVAMFREMPLRGYAPDSYTYGTIINGLCKWGKISEARELFSEMEKNDCSPSVVTYSTLIHGLCRSGMYVEGFRLFEDMVGRGIKPNVFTYSSLMDGFFKSGHSSKAVELLDAMVRRRLRPNNITYSTLISGLCKERKVCEALDILDRMKLQGLKPDAGLYGKIIGGFCDMEKFREAANSLDEMILDGVSPSRVTWSLHIRIHNTVLQGLCSHDDVDRAYKLYLSMRSRAISVEPSSLTALLKCLSVKDGLHKLSRVLDEMFLDGYSPEVPIWEAVLARYLASSKEQEVAEYMMDLVGA